MAAKPPIAVEKFGGMVPVLDDRALPDQFSAMSQNVALYSQVLQGFSIPELIYALKKTTTKYVFRVPNDYAATGLKDPSFWMEFDSPDTSVIHSPTVDDQFDRYYWVEPGKPPMYNTAAGIRAGSPPYLLGIPGPEVMPGVTPPAALPDDVVESRAYLYTWVSGYGEEGPPSPPNVTDGPSSGTWHLTFTAPTAVDTAQRNLTHTDIYRTVTSSNGVATYFFVDQIPIAQLAYDDVFTDDQITGNNQLQATDCRAGRRRRCRAWSPCLTGIILGWDGTDVLFCEPYRPHSWPSGYRLTTDYPVVGAGVYGQSGVLCTESVPHVVTGNHPSVMTMQKINMVEPCLSRGSIVAGALGVYYASINGLALVSPSGVSLITKEIIGTRRWNQIVTPSHLRAVRYSGVYVAFDVDDGSITPPLPGAQFGCIIDPTDQRVSFCRINNKTAVDNVLVDTWSGDMLLLGEGGVYQFDPPGQPTQIVFSWKSKRFHYRKKTNFSVAKIYFDQVGVSDIPTDNPWARSNSIDLPAGVPLQFRLWANDALVYDQPQYTSGAQISLPGGFKAEWWQFEIVGQVNVVSVHMAVDAKDLVQV